MGGTLKSLGFRSVVLRIGFGLGVVLSFFFGTLLLLNYFDSRSDKQSVALSACQNGEVVVLPKPYGQVEGYAYKASLRSLASLSDSNANLSRSPALLCENNDLLGPPHTPWAEIAKQGSGRYSHFDDSVVFSSSDNTDPNVNNRRYTVVVPVTKRLQP